MPTTNADQSRYAAPEDLSRYAWLAIGTAVATIGLKVGAWWLTDSVGLLSDAAESLVNLVAAILALYTLTVSVRPPDDDHPYGHSKAEYFSAAAEGLMIFIAAVIIIVKAVERLITPAPIENVGLGLLISSSAALLNGLVAMLLIRKGRQHRSAVLVADGRHLMTDLITSIGVIVGVGLVVLTGEPRMDPIVALVAGANITYTGVKLLRSSVDGLMDVALPADVHAEIDDVLDGFRSDDVDFHALRTRESGNRRFMSFHVLVPGDWSVKEGHDFTEDVIDALVAKIPDLRVTAHLEPKDDPRSYDDLDI